MSPTSIGGGKAQITGGEHISRLVETPTEVVLPVAKPERRRYKSLRQDRQTVYSVFPKGKDNERSGRRFFFLILIFDDHINAK